jgi:hypothetical protein
MTGLPQNGEITKVLNYLVFLEVLFFCRCAGLQNGAVDS